MLSVLPGVEPQAFDKVLVAGLPNPGIARVSDFCKEYTYDLKQAPGAAGENMTYKGVKNVSFSVECYLLGDQEVSDWVLWSYLWEIPNGKPQAVEVSHPLLEARGVFTACALKVYSPKQSRPGDNLWIGKVEAVQWSPPPPANVSKSPTGAKAGGTEGQAGGPPAETARQREIRELTQKFKDA